MAAESASPDADGAGCNIDPGHSGPVESLGTKRAPRLPAKNHFSAIRVKRVINDPLGRIDLVVVLVAETAKALGDRAKPGGFRLLPQRVVRIRAIDDSP